MTARASKKNEVAKKRSEVRYVRMASLDVAILTGRSRLVCEMLLDGTHSYNDCPTDLDLFDKQFNALP